MSEVRNSRGVPDPAPRRSVEPPGWTGGSKRSAAARRGASPATAAVAEESKTLSAELLHLLTELAATLRKGAMYPAGHPAVEPALQALHAQLAAALAGRERLTLNVGRDRLLVEGATTDPSNLLLHGLAARLHAHDLAAVSFRRGVQRGELTELVAELAREPQLEGNPLGRAPRETLERWRHIRVEPLRYDPLAWGGDQTTTPARDRETAFFDLGTVPFSTDIAGQDLLRSEASQVAEHIEERLSLGEQPVDRMIAVQLFRLAENLANAEGRAAELLSRRMSELVFCLQPETVAYLVELGEEGGRLNRFLSDASRWMEAEAMLELVRVAATHRNDVVAPWLLRIMSKMAMLAGFASERAAAEADGAIRALIRRLVDNWELEDPRPVAYAETLQRLVRPSADGLAGGDRAGAAGDEVGSVEPALVVQLGLDLDDAGEAVRRSAARMVHGGQAAALLDLLESAPPESRAADALWQRISTPETVLQLLRAEPPDFRALDRIIDRLGTEAADALLQALSAARSRFVRRQLFDRLSRIGPRVLPYLVARLSDPRWYVVRNMLALIHEVGVWPAGLDIAPLLHHQEARVRAEAVRLALSHPPERSRAVCVALADPDRRVVALGLAAAEESCPPAAEVFLVAHARNEELAPELGRAAVRALAGLGSARALRALVDLCLWRRWLFWKRLAPASPPVLEAIRALAARWPEDQRAQAVLRRAARSGDPDLRQAAEAATEESAEAEPALDRPAEPEEEEATGS